MSTKTLQALLRADLHMSLVRHVMARDSFPEETVRSCRVRYFESIYLDVCKRVGLL